MAEIIHPRANGHPTAAWASPAGLMAMLALISALVSIGWNYRGLAATEEEVRTLKTNVATLQDKQERVAVLEVKLDTALRALDKISLQLEARARPVR